MRAIRVNQHGGPANLIAEDVPIPELAVGEVLVKNHAVGINFLDVYYREGKYLRDLPFTSGHEAAGVIVQIAGGLKDIRVSDKETAQILHIGDRVAFVQRGSGSYAEFTAIAARKVIKIGGTVDANAAANESQTAPQTLSFELAAAAMHQGLTAHYLMRSVFPVSRGHKVLIHAAAGGLGLVLSQLCRNAGALVVGTCSSEEKAQMARQAGCHHVINYSQIPDFVTEVRRVTEGKGVNVVYDGVGKATFLLGLDCLAPQGMMVLFGGASGPVDPFDPLLLSHKGSIYLSRPTLFDFIKEREDLEWRSSEVLDWIRSGKLAIGVGKKYPLEEASRAHEALGDRSRIGKIILTCL